MAIPHCKKCLAAKGQRGNDRRPFTDEGVPPHGFETSPTTPGSRHDEEKAGDEPQSAASPSVFGLILVLVPTVLCSFLVFLDSAIITTAIPAITHDFGDISDIGWYSSAYYLSVCVMQPLMGRFFGRLPLRITFFAFFASFEVGSLVCALARSSGMLIAGRVLAGVGGAGVLSGSLAILSASVPLERRPLSLSICLGLGQFGPAFGPLIGGAFTQNVTWRWCFYLNLPLGGFAILVLLLAPIPKYSEPEPTLSNGSTSANSKTKAIASLDWTGFGLFAAAVVMILLPLQWGSDETKAWKSSTVIGLFVGSACTAAVFVLWQRHRGDEALLPLNIIRQTIVWTSCLQSFLQMGNMVTTIYYLPLWYQVVREKSPILSGLYILPMIAAHIVFTVLTAALAGKFGLYALWGIISGIIVAVGGGLLVSFEPHMSAGLWVGAELLIGVGRGCSLQMPYVAIQDTFRTADAAVGTSLAIFGQYFGGAVFSGISEAILLSSLTTSAKKNGIDPKAISAGVAYGAQSGKSAAYIDAYNNAIVQVFWIAVASACAMMLTSLGMGWKKRKPPL